jgi:hypothetical protein
MRLAREPRYAGSISDLPHHIRNMQLNAFDVLIGLRLSIIRRAADMLVLHFGTIRPHLSGEGTLAEYALHDAKSVTRVQPGSGALFAGKNGPEF